MIVAGLLCCEQAQLIVGLAWLTCCNDLKPFVRKDIPDPDEGGSRILNLITIRGCFHTNTKTIVQLCWRSKTCKMNTSQKDPIIIHVRTPSANPNFAALENKSHAT